MLVRLAPLRVLPDADVAPGPAASQRRRRRRRASWVVVVQLTLLGAGAYAAVAVLTGSGSRGDAALLLGAATVAGIAELLRRALGRDVAPAVDPAARAEVPVEPDGQTAAPATPTWISPPGAPAAVEHDHRLSALEELAAQEPPHDLPDATATAPADAPAEEAATPGAADDAAAPGAADDAAAPGAAGTSRVFTGVWSARGSVRPEVRRTPQVRCALPPAPVVDVAPEVADASEPPPATDRDADIDLTREVLAALHAGQGGAEG